MPDFDAAYASILRANHLWFDVLAGKDPKGLRDVVVHHSAVYQFGWSEPDTNVPFELKAGLYTDAGFVEQDLVEALRKITGGWFAFLDAAWRHFMFRLANGGVLLTMSANEAEKTRYLQCTEGELPSFWVYPWCA
jgi:hypothetical protein